ncbi:MAG: NUDIX hydrolase [Candidatus Promineofilum sp.]|nr:NUDIX hydrolase [Promineifilum sp.]
MTDWLKQEVVHRGTIITVKKATRRAADGRIHEFDIVEHYGGVGIVPLLGDRVVLVRQPRPVVGRALLEIPAGKLEGPDDDVEARAQAELGEEVGYRAGRLIPAAEFFVSPGYCTERIHVFLGLDLEPVEAHPEPSEEIERVDVALSDVRHMLDEGQFHDSKTIIGLRFLLAFLEGNK